MSARAVITLLTDFGSSDPFVGMMKGVIASICPEANVIDLTHEVPPQDVRLGAFLLERSARYFPPGTVHVAVVDPGVGTARAKLALSSRGQLFVGPDNGLLSLAAPRAKAVRIERASYFLPKISSTFHGRDVFCPVAAHLALGLPLERLGRALRSFVRLTWPKPKRDASGFVGTILSVDRFGNLVTNVAPADWSAVVRPRLHAGGFQSSTLSTTYEDVKPGDLALVFGGYGLLEIAARGESAALRLGLGRGDRVRVTRGSVHKTLHRTLHR